MDCFTLYGGIHAYFTAGVLAVTFRQKWTKRQTIGMVVIFLMAVSTTVVLEWVLLMAFGLKSPHVLPGYFVALDISASIIVIVLFRWWYDTRNGHPARWHLLTLTIFLIPVWVFLSSRDYIQKLYVQVPEALGGAKPVSAELILNKDGLEFWKQTGLSTVNAQSASTGPIMILYQNEHDFVVKAPYKDGQQTKEKLIIFNKSLVNGFLPAEQSH